MEYVILYSLQYATTIEANSEEEARELFLDGMIGGGELPNESFEEDLTIDNITPKEELNEAL